MKVLQYKNASIQEVTIYTFTDPSLRCQQPWYDYLSRSNNELQFEETKNH